MTPVGSLIILLLSIFSWIVIIDVVLSWLVNFEVVNRGNQGVRTIQNFTRTVTEPCLRPIRKVIPPIANLDISPIVLLIAIWFAQRVVVYIGI